MRLDERQLSRSQFFFYDDRNVLGGVETPDAVDQAFIVEI